MPLNILIVGAGCAGPALAHVLEKANPRYNITVIERFPTLRTGGQQLDLKAEGIPIAKSMGILDGLKAACVHETGMRLLDKNGKTLMQFGINDSSGKGKGLTNEYEIMRGDMVKVFYDASLAERQRIEESGEKGGSLTYRFDTTVTHLEQSDRKATVTFSNGQKEAYDLVVAADGQNSRTRRIAYGEEASKKGFRSIGVHAAYFEIPRMEFDNNDARIFFASKSRMIMTRSGDRSKTQVYFFLMKDKERHEKMKGVHKQPLAQQKEAWAEIYQDAGWECQRFIEGMKTTEDFYAHELGQIHMPQLHSGRVVLVGDAGYCPTAFTGMGTTLSLIGSHILAGELAKHGDNVDAALQRYNELMQPPLKRYRNLPEGTQTSFYPASELGIKITNSILWSLSALKVDKAAQWFAGMLPEGKSKWDLPSYPELTVEHGTT
jgi:2-polyprenyl-6-methoxyphenol hydroxylase-like FAD-dependent oxidoreductase